MESHVTLRFRVPCSELNKQFSISLQREREEVEWIEKFPGHFRAEHSRLRQGLCEITREGIYDMLKSSNPTQKPWSGRASFARSEQRDINREVPLNKGFFMRRARVLKSRS